ncbi:hypothetical protein A2154_04640 [Candidatus Gottesmanbacteria bacterium RBG_16_43_7]|uniref:Methyltransferase type 11 domain-containing protein n=1 Tax=Candidatus Gottesmanbacteria bacterium RBG_16_43_7 TaxID=1798373 RepID=A0A1F5Z8U3_9BACT|nr:MAG: hypothetical protein A2154_04640 [Candidatus Gottesmanbacteria bacterium RBG_16_43_7]
MSEVKKGIGHKVELTDHLLFTPLSVTKDELLVVSPQGSIRSSQTYNDQVLERFPLLVDFTIEDLKDLLYEQILPAGPILEIGCGSGVLIETLRKSGYPAYGIEILDTFGDIWRARNIDQFCFIGNAENMPGVNNGFTLIITRAFWDSAFGTVEEGGLNNPFEIFKEMKRVLKTGGVFIPLAERGHEDNLELYANKIGFKGLVKSNKVFGYIKADS